MKANAQRFLLATLTLASVAYIPRSYAQVSMSPGSYSQNFNSLPTTDCSWTDNSTLPGWYANTNGGSGGTVTAIRASFGSTTSSSLYSYGASGDPDRALGSQAGGGPGDIAYGVRFINDTANVATNLWVSYTGEQWRRITSVGTNTLTFSYCVGSNITSANADGTGSPWVSLFTLDFSSPNTAGATGALVGNASTNRQTLASFLLPNVQVGPGQELFLRWLDVDDSGTDHGLGIDDLTVTNSWAAPAAPYITSQPSSPKARPPGSTATFAVTVTGTAPFAYQWKKDGNPLVDGVDNVRGANTATLSITNVSAATHNGIYTCGITNIVKGTNTTGTTLAVIDPGIITQPSSSTNPLGEKQAFSVAAGGTGAFEYQWRKNGTNIASATTSVLIITNVAASDVASYSVVVTNSLGNSVTSSAVTLSLLTTPSVRIAQWDFNGTPDGTNITGATTPTIGGGTASLIGYATATFSSGAAQDPILATVDNSGWNTTAYPTATASNKTTGVQFQFSTVGYRDILLTWHERHSGSASRYARMQYSTDGTTFTDIHLVTRTNTDFDREVVDLSSIPAVNNNPNFAFRVVSEFESTATGYGAASYVGSSGNYSASQGTIRFDWLNVFANPDAPAGLRIASLNGAGTASVTVNYTNTIVGTNYTVQYRTNFNTTNWTTVGTKTAASTGDFQTDSTAAGAPRRFYRVFYVKP